MLSMSAAERAVLWLDARNRRLQQRLRSAPSSPVNLFTFVERRAAYRVNSGICHCTVVSICRPPPVGHRSSILPLLAPLGGGKLGGSAWRAINSTGRRCRGGRPAAVVTVKAAGQARPAWPGCSSRCRCSRRRRRRISVLISTL